MQDFVATSDLMPGRAIFGEDNGCVFAKIFRIEEAAIVVSKIETVTVGDDNILGNKSGRANGKSRLRQNKKLAHGVRAFVRLDTSNFPILIGRLCVLQVQEVVRRNPRLVNLIRALIAATG